jgi:predicted site-specific integrase-resolvase
MIIAEEVVSMEKLLTSHQAAMLLNVWPHTLRRWEKAGKIKPLHTPGGHRRYKEAQLIALIGAKTNQKKLPQEELVEDMIAIVTSFSARVYDKNGKGVTKKLVTLIEEEVAAGEDHR